MEIPTNRVLPGDVIVYFDSMTGDAEHSGVVISAPSEEMLWVPIVLSKWGKAAEVVHPANSCPYDYSAHRFYRMMR